ncbi:MAG: hypothetical protein HRT53_19230 [Colwellia sp.]|nr:hypothetical protein [Colwellia sp.]
MQDEDFEPVTKEVTIPREQLARLQATLKSPTILIEKLVTISLWLPKKLLSWWQVLHSNQKIYLLAVIFGISQDQSLSPETLLEPNTGLLIVGSIAMIGMLRELLNIFTQVWQTLLGKSLIFIMYVIIGNFTLAVAARKVNYITGVDPDSLIYAQGFTTVLVLPLWLLLLTSMSLILLFTLGNVWFLFLKLVNLLRLHPINVRVGERFSVLFIFIRLLLISPIMVTLMQPLNWYNNELNIEMPGVVFTTSEIGDSENKDPKNDLIESTEGQSGETSPKEVSVSADDVHSSKQDEGIVILDTDINDAKDKYTDFDRAIATFVYEYETFQLSRCEKTDAERVSIIGEDIILVAEKVEGHALGYKFSARSCVLRDYK